MTGFEWPWLLFAAPAPWLVRRLLPIARCVPPPALWIPFFDRVAADARDYGPDGAGVAVAVVRHYALPAWVALVLAAARPAWEGEALYVWPLALAVILAMVAGLQATRRPPRVRALPAGRGRERRQ